MFTRRITPAPWTPSGFRVASECRPADEPRGDFCVANAPRPCCLRLLIGDASGHGRAGARLVPQILSEARKLVCSDIGPGEVLAELNRIAIRMLPSDRFVTAAMLELDADQGVLRVANAGHVPLLARRPDLEVQVFGRPSGPPLGITTDARYAEESVPLRVGDTVVVMTDGVLEAVEKDLVEMNVLRELLATARPGANAAWRSIVEALDRACLEHSLSDDAMLFSVEVVAGAGGSRPCLKQAS